MEKEQAALIWYNARCIVPVLCISLCVDGPWQIKKQKTHTSIYREFLHGVYAWATLRRPSLEGVNCDRYFSHPFPVRGGSPLLRAALPVQDAEAEACGGGAADGGPARYGTSAHMHRCVTECAQVTDDGSHLSRPPKDSLLPGYQKQAHHDSIMRLQNHNQEDWRRGSRTLHLGGGGVGGSVLVFVVPQ